MSPPSKNQVIQPPNLRPPSPHSSRSLSDFVLRQRAATNPSPETSTKNAMTIASWSSLTPPLIACAHLGRRGS